MKSLWKWCTVVVVAALVLGWGSQLGSQAQDSAWKTVTVAEGPDASKQRTLYPDVDAVGNWVIVGYIDQATDTVNAAVSSDGGQNLTKFEIAKPGKRVIGTSVAVIELPDGTIINCFDWIQLGDVIEVWVVCWSFKSGTPVTGGPLSDPVRLSAEGVPAGQHDLQGDWTGNLDGARWQDPNDKSKFVFYEIWAENYDTLKAAKSKDGVTWEACGDIPNQSGTDVRFPTVYVDAKGRVYAGATQTGAPDVQAWVSYDGCATWQGPTNVTGNGGFSDAPEFAVIGDKFYSSNDDTTTNPNNVDLNFSVCDVTADAGLANCAGTRGVYKDGAWARLKTDGTNLHLSGENHGGGSGLVVYCYSTDGGASWIGDPIPNSKPNSYGVRDPDFGIIISRNAVAVSGTNVYIAWATRAGGKSKVMLSSRTAPPSGTPAATCAP